MACARWLVRDGLCEMACARWLVATLWDLSLMACSPAGKGSSFCKPQVCAVCRAGGVLRPFEVHMAAAFSPVGDSNEHM